FPRSGPWTTVARCSRAAPPANGNHAPGVAAKRSTTQLGRCTSTVMSGAERAPCIRTYAPGDFYAVTAICLRTAEAGQDATGLYVSDELMPDIFAKPYILLEPELAFVLDA